MMNNGSFATMTFQPQSAFPAGPQKISNPSLLSDKLKLYDMVTIWGRGILMNGNWSGLYFNGGVVSQSEAVEIIQNQTPIDTARGIITFLMRSTFNVLGTNNIVRWFTSGVPFNDYTTSIVKISSNADQNLSLPSFSIPVNRVVTAGYAYNINTETGSDVNTSDWEWVPEQSGYNPPWPSGISGPTIPCLYGYGTSIWTLIATSYTNILTGTVFPSSIYSTKSFNNYTYNYLSFTTNFTTFLNAYWDYWTSGTATTFEIYARSVNYPGGSYYFLAFQPWVVSCNYSAQWAYPYYLMNTTLGN
jgi:hypothetical protein